MATNDFVSRIQAPRTIGKDCVFISQTRSGQLWEKEMKPFCIGSKYKVAGLVFPVPKEARLFPRIFCLRTVAASRK